MRARLPRVLMLACCCAAAWMVNTSAQKPRTGVPAVPAGKPIALVGGMLLTGYEVPPIHHAAVIVEGHTITAAGPLSEIRIPAGATVIDTTGRTMLPGLIEAHGHLIVLGSGSYDTWFPWIAAHGGAAMQRTITEIAAKQLLMAGITTTVDLGAPLQTILGIRDRINAGDVVGTRVLASGPWIARLPPGSAGSAMQQGFGALQYLIRGRGGAESR